MHAGRLASASLLTRRRRPGERRRLLALALALAASPAPFTAEVRDATGALVGLVDLTLRSRPGVLLAVPVERAVARFSLSRLGVLARVGAELAAVGSGPVVFHRAGRLALVGALVGRHRRMRAER